MELKKIWLPAKEVQRHTFITGQTGCGKSVLLMQLLHQQVKRDTKKSVVVLDPHGDLVNDLLSIPAHSNFKFIYIDPALNKGFTPCINPFDILDPGDEIGIDKLSQELAKAFDSMIKDSSLSTQMMALLTPCIATLLRRPGSSFFDLQRFMDDEHNQDLVDYGKKTNNVAHRRFFNDAFYKQTYKATKGSIYTKLQSLLNSSFFYNLTTGKSTVKLYDELEQQRIILFNLSKGRMGPEASEAFGRFISALLLAFALKRAESEKSRYPCFLYIDEFQNFTNESLDVILSEARKYGLYLTLACQMLGQNADTQLKNNLLSNTAIKIVGQNSMKTLGTLGSEMGVKTEQLKKLKPREFYVKAGHREAYKGKTSSYLVDYIKTHRKRPTLDDFREYYTEIQEVDLDTVIEAQAKISDLQTEIEDKTFTPKYELEW